MLTTKKLISWLTFITIFTFSIQSCIHDDIYSSSDPTSEEYHSKSLWKEDEIYIKNIIKIYGEHENEIRKEHGIPLWDYAMTLDKFNESYLVVPIRENGKISKVLEVPRFGRKVYFRYSNDVEKVALFNQLMIDRPKKPLPANSANGTSKIVCVVKTFSMWYPDSESNPNGSGHWVTSSYTICIDLTIDTFENPDDGSGNGGYDYPPSFGGDSGITDSTAILQNQDITIDQLQNYPCAHSIAQQLPNLNNSIASNMRQIFQNNTKYNITFKAKSGLGATDGETFATYSTEFDTFNAVINLNDEVLLNATKEYILVTMYHEVLHAFLKYQLYKLGNTEFQAQYPGVTVGYDYAPNGTITNTFTFIEGHAQLVPFLTTLQNIVSQYNPNLPNNVITAISRAGITTLTPEQVQLNSNERNTLLGNNLGTKCP